MGREICLELRVGSETRGATRPGGLECHAKDFLLCPFDFGAALEGFVRRQPCCCFSLGTCSKDFSAHSKISTSREWEEENE